MQFGNNIFFAMSFNLINFSLILNLFNCQLNLVVAISNGKLVKNPETLNFMVQIWTKSDEFLHAGLILNKWAVITVANKVLEHATRKYKNLEVIAGEYTIDKKTQLKYRFDIHRVFYHPESFRKYTLPQVDVAILKLTEPFEFNLKSLQINPAPITRKITPTGNNCSVIGWGKSNNKKPFEKNYMPHQGVLYLVPSSECQINTPEMLCGSRQFSQVETCNGDEGGPVICYNQEEDKKPLVHGMIWGCSAKCGLTSEIFISLYSHREWIDFTLKSMKTA